ncbi:MAG TPA: translocation/assembly module TamB, partial [Chlamydiales bacterium]|nr:translocation/assembly module TamB [Chlamydiales bacterium]
MKKIGIWLFLVFIVVAAVYAVMQSTIGQNLVRSFVTSSLQKSGYAVTIDHIEGTLPHQIELKGLTVTGKNVDITVEQLSLRPVLWRLIKNEIAFTDVKAKGISFEKGIPFDFEGQFRMSKRSAFLQGQIDAWTLTTYLDLTNRLLFYTVANPLVVAKGQMQLDPAYQIASAKGEIQSELHPFLAHLSATRKEGAYEIQGTWQWDKVEGSAEGVLSHRNIKGEIGVGPYGKATLDLEILPDWRLIGITTFAIENLQALHIPNAYGKLEGKAEWHLVDQSQGLRLDVTASDFYYKTLFAQKVSVYSDLLDPFQSLKGTADFEFERAKWNNLLLESGSFETTGEKDYWTFTFFGEGKWKHPFEVHINGSWRDHFIADIENFDGTFFNHPFVLTKPVHFEYTQDIFRLPEAEITIAGSTAFVHIDRNGDRTDARLRFHRLPLDFLSLNPLDLSVVGILDLEADIHEAGNLLQGDLKASIEQMEVASLGLNEKLNAAGAFEGHFDRDLLSLKGALNVRNTPLLNLDLSLPIHFSLWPFEAELLTHKNSSGHIALDGRIEDFLDFLNFGPHRLEGACHCDLELSRTLYRPQLEGYLRFENGFYENYYTGTQLRNITADFAAEKNTLRLRSFKAQDALGTGTLNATGEIKLQQGDLYPFQLDLAFTNLQFVEIDLVAASAEGNVHIEGNTSSALAKGDVRIIKSELSIPDHIPRPLPNLQVVYVNPIHPVPPPETSYQPYPLYLDLHVTAPESVSISGRGLSSEWRGDFHIGGTFTSLAAKGKLELIDGEFNFSSRSFKLTDGSVTFSGAEHEMPNINIAGAIETHGVSVIARLKGPINDPQITLQSVPPLPLGSIMSYLLFGQDLADISGFQALQLASSVAGMAGTGSDIMESTRRSLGVDRLRVIAEPTEEGGEMVSLQVGKYISKGVLVSFTQGTEDSSTNVSVEVE